jgi:predicted signal transduction protein with EAL and GGDEF domain
VDYLKIDRSFISGGNSELENREIVGTIISLARNLGLRVVAEGVEEQGQYDMLRQMNCDDVQGFMFSRPVGAPQAEDLLEAYIASRRKAQAAEAPRLAHSEPAPDREAPEPDREALKSDHEGDEHHNPKNSEEIP